FIGILAFGLPIFLLPNKIEGEKWCVVAYNKSLGSEFYTEKIRPITDKMLGGTFRLFVEFVREESYFSTPERTSLNVKVKLPQGASLQHLNDIYTDIENYLSQFNEIDFFQTSISSIENSGLVIYFDKAFDSGSFPYFLKGKLESKAIEISSADFTIYGVGRGFNNALSHGFKGSRMIFSGYNYNELLTIARAAKAKFLKNPRIQEVFIESGKAWWFYDVENSYLTVDKKLLAQREVSFYELVQQLERFNLRTNVILNLPYNGSFEELSLVSDFADKYDRWDMNELELGTKNNIKLKDIASRFTENASKTIYRENQEYILTVAYDFIGPDELSRMVLEEYEKEISAQLPIGYKAEIFKYAGWWNAKEKTQYLLLVIMIIIIYFICSILLESFVQPLIVISVIPLSFIGIFLTFYFTGVKFDQGGYASFLLVSGLVVNAALYILNDMNVNCQNKPAVSRLNNYVKAFNSKIIPILLTIASTVLGLIPFIFWGRNEPFWFALSAGTIGGLLFSIPITIIFLPIMIKNKSTNNAK
ncbi:MAG: efflux RND transporter permease subunit, partial [Bacteroidales bacterium]